MNSEISEQINYIKTKLFSYDIVKEYFSLSDAIKNNEELQSYFREKAFHKKNLIPSQSNKDDYLREKSLYEDACKKIDEHPLIINFKYAKEQVLNLVAEIKETLEL